MKQDIPILSLYLTIFGFLSAIYVLILGGTSIVFYLAIGIVPLILFLRIEHGVLIIYKRQFDKLYIGIFLSSIGTILSAIFFTDYAEQWIWQAIVFFIYYSVLFVLYILLNSISTNHIFCFYKGLKCCILLQILYGYIQYFIYKISGIDLNELIFDKILNLGENMSHYNYNELVPSGFSWHPGTYAPLLAIGYCMFFNDIRVKLLIVVISALTQSSTCILGIFVCVALDILNSSPWAKKKIKKKKIFVIVIAILVSSIVIVSTDLINVLVDSFVRLIMRTIGSDATVIVDLSSYYHKRYFTGLWEIIKEANIMQLLFGCGYGCSGYAFVKVFSQYVNSSPWDVESQIVADLLSRGIIGFSFTYAWIVRIIHKGMKIDKRYVICMSAILAESITYNVCFFWVLIFEMILYISIKNEFNIWEVNTITNRNK